MDSKVAQIFKRSNYYSNTNIFNKIQGNNNFKYRGMEILWNNKPFPSLNVINGKSYAYVSKGVLRNYHYRSEIKFVQGVVAIRCMTRSYSAYTTILPLPWDSTTEEAFKQKIYCRVYNCTYFLIIGSPNNWIILNFIDDGTDNVDYKCVNQTILDGNVMNII